MNWPSDIVNLIHCANAPELLKLIPDEVIDMCLTSPPYFGKRDYGITQIFGGDKNCDHDFSVIHRRVNDKSGGHQGIMIGTGTAKAQDAARFGNPTRSCSKCNAWLGQLGLEPSPELYIFHLIDIFNEVKRVLKKEGSLWLNIGDSYWTAKGSCYNPGGGKSSFEGIAKRKEKQVYPRYRGNISDIPYLLPKSLMMIPERLAFSLIQNGWRLRNRIPWIKPQLYARIRKRQV